MALARGALACTGWPSRALARGALACTGWSSLGLHGMVFNDLGAWFDPDDLSRAGHDDLAQDSHGAGFS